MIFPPICPKEHPAFSVATIQLVTLWKTLFWAFHQSFDHLNFCAAHMHRVQKSLLAKAGVTIQKSQLLAIPTSASES
ncbi:MAG: hypothetical protein NTX04_11465 [Verrucomicrobia bacterium]|nr:hypothetical protein [Verrucomicrobiota bacterium]